jgi:GWxTD domain-containing protein
MRTRIYLPLMMLMLALTSADAVAGEMLRGEGDFEFFVDTASIPFGSDRTISLIQIAIPTKELKYKKIDGRFLAVAGVKISIMNGDETFFEKGYEIRDTRSTEPLSKDLSEFIFVSDSCHVEPGSYSLNIVIDDQNRKKKTLFGLIHRSYYNSKLKAESLVIPSYSGDGIALGDPVLIWSKRGKTRFVPNPMQIYGLKNDTLSFYVAARMPRASTIDSVDVNMSIVNRSGEPVGEMSTRAAVSNGIADIFGNFDVNAFPAGTYRILTEVADPGGGASAFAGKDFSVAWELVNWQKPRRDVLLEAQLLFSETQYEAFQKESFGEQERILGEFWKKLDPTPHTAVNEAYEKFVERVKYADAHYGGFSRGALSDRGLIYIRFGPPNEVSFEIIPLNRNEVSEAIGKLQDQYNILIHSIIDERKDFSTMRPRMITGESRPFRGLEGMDTGAYELWIYNMLGDPILDKDRLMTINAGYRFLFIDLDGVGNYQLVGTSEEFQDQQISEQ